MQVIKTQRYSFKKFPKYETVVIMYYLSVIAGKGGVGKTTVTILLARALQKLGIKVGILDADIYGPSIAGYFEQAERPQETDQGIIPASFCNIKNISLGYFRQQSKQISHLVRAPIANAIIESFLNEIVWDGLDLLLVDFPPGTGDVPLTLMQSIPFTGSIVVTTPEEMAKWDVEKALEMLVSMKVPILGLLQNKSFLLDGERKIVLYTGSAAQELSEQFQTPLLGELPFEPGILERLKEKKSWLSSETTPLLTLMGEIAVEIRDKIWDNAAGGEVSVRKLDDHSIELVLKGSEPKMIRSLELQKQCPCASCSGVSSIKEESSIMDVVRVGNFGWKFYFSHGCSQGIYSDEFFKSRFFSVSASPSRLLHSESSL